MQIECRTSSLLECFAEMPLIFWKDSASERNESLLSNCRVQLIFCKDNANERNENLFSNCRVQLFFCKDNVFF